MLLYCFNVFVLDAGPQRIDDDDDDRQKPEGGALAKHPWPPLRSQGTAAAAKGKATKPGGTVGGMWCRAWQRTRNM